MQKFREKWNKYEVLEVETNRYPFRILIALGLLVLFFVIFAFLLVIDPSLNKYPNVSITLVTIALLSVLLSIYVSAKSTKTISKVWPYDPHKTQEWRQKQDDKQIRKDYKELLKE